jgi:DNA polymerase-4
MRELGILTGADLQARAEHELARLFGRVGRHYWRIARALDDRPVQPDRPRRSLSVETTFARDLRLPAELEGALGPLAAELARRLAQASFLGRTLTLKLRYADFQIVSRSATRPACFTRPEQILSVGQELLAHHPRPSTPVRLLGLGVSGHAGEEDPRQLALPLTERRSAAW